MDEDTCRFGSRREAAHAWTDAAFELHHRKAFNAPPDPEREEHLVDQMVAAVRHFADVRAEVPE
jgi:hypothetical protein